MKERKAPVLTFGEVGEIKKAIEADHPHAEKIELIAAAWETGYKAALDDLAKEGATK